MKLLSLVVIFLLMFCIACDKNRSINQEENITSRFDYSKVVFDKIYYLDSIKLDSVYPLHDTIRYVVTDNYYSYFSEVNVEQQVQYLFQKYINLGDSEYNYIQIFFSYPKRKNSESILITSMPLNAFIQSLNFFRYDEVNRLINELYVLDSEYNQVNILDILTTQLEIARSEIDGDNPIMFGTSVNEFVYTYIFNCAKNEVKGKQILQRAKDIIVRDKIAMIGVANDINRLFKKYCRQVEINMESINI